VRALWRIACRSIARLEVASEEDQWISECPDRAPYPAARPARIVRSIESRAGHWPEKAPRRPSAPWNINFAPPRPRSIVDRRFRQASHSGSPLRSRGLCESLRSSRCYSLGKCTSPKRMHRESRERYAGNYLEFTAAVNSALDNRAYFTRTEGIKADKCDGCTDRAD